ncbi:MAG: cold shock domain-containing protein [bacterium]|nr:cold shock domain-containing protein [bacterium]
METGTVAKKMDKGYGFIARDGQQKELFFHANELNGISFDELNEGDTVTFELSEGPKGPQATNVSRA